MMIIIIITHSIHVNVNGKISNARFNRFKYFIPMAKTVMLLPGPFHLPYIILSTQSSPPHTHTPPQQQKIWIFTWININIKYSPYTISQSHTHTRKYIIIIEQINKMHVPYACIILKIIKMIVCLFSVSVHFK